MCVPRPFTNETKSICPGSLSLSTPSNVLLCSRNTALPRIYYAISCPYAFAHMLPPLGEMLLILLDTGYKYTENVILPACTMEEIYKLAIPQKGSNWDYSSPAHCLG